jgi:quinol monooxygenase YgiN
MNRQPLIKLVLIHTRPDNLPELWQLLSDSVARTRNIDGCLHCQLHISCRSPQHWIIYGMWSGEDALQTSLTQELQRAFEGMLNNLELSSIIIYGNDGCLPPVDLMNDIELG